jgi:dihydroorotase/N-acyl-D-amino-acid deacylase
MDADIVVFDPATIIDRATYQEPVLPPEGIEAVIVNGVLVLRDGSFAEGVHPGEAIRAEVKP